MVPNRKRVAQRWQRSSALAGPWPHPRNDALLHDAIHPPASIFGKESHLHWRSKPSGNQWVISTWAHLCISYIYEIVVYTSIYIWNSSPQKKTTFICTFMIPWFCRSLPQKSQWQKSKVLALASCTSRFCKCQRWMIPSEFKWWGACWEAGNGCYITIFYIMLSG